MTSWDGDETPIPPELLKELIRETTDRLLKDLPVEKRLEGISAEELLAALSAQEREELAGLLKVNGSEPKPEWSDWPMTCGYREESLTKPDPLEEFTRETIDRLLKELPVAKRLEGLSAEELLPALSPQDRYELARLLKANGSEPKPE